MQFLRLQLPRFLVRDGRGLPDGLAGARARCAVRLVAGEALGVLAFLLEGAGGLWFLGCGHVGVGEGGHAVCVCFCSIVDC